MSKLFGYDFYVEFKPGRSNIVADALSQRHQEDGALFVLSTPQFDIFNDLRQETIHNPDLVTLHDQIINGSIASPWSVVDGLVLYKTRVHVLHSSSVL